MILVVCSLMGMMSCDSSNGDAGRGSSEQVHTDGDGEDLEGEGAIGPGEEGIVEGQTDGPEVEIGERVSGNEKVYAPNGPYDESGSLKEIDRSDFDAVAQVVGWGLHNNDLDLLDQFIHPDTGLYFIQKPGAIPMVWTCQKMADAKDVYPWIDELWHPEPDFKLAWKEGSLPGFSCEGMKYDKAGHYAGNMGECSELTNLLGFLVENQMAKPHVRDCGVSLEKFSREIILTDDAGGSGFIFWLSRIDGEWWFSLYDMARDDCSA